jgi:hypothetical protein
MIASNMATSDARCAADSVRPRWRVTYQSGKSASSRRSSASSYGGSWSARDASCQRTSASSASA